MRSISLGSWTRRRAPRLLLAVAATVVLVILARQGLAAYASPDPLSAPAGAAWIDIGVLVFREGLECVLVLSAITASMTGPTRHYRRPVAAGASAAFLATLATWAVAVRVIDSLATSVPALHVQAITGLLAVIVLLVVMNWFFHKVYWTGWISVHTNKKRELLADAGRPASRVMLGLALLGFTSLYREGVEVVLFLQTYRMKLGPDPVFWGVAIGLALTLAVAVITFLMHRHLPYRKMLVFTGVLLGGVLLVMVGEQAQEMQLVGWLPTTTIGWLAPRTPAWMSLWLSVFPTVETLIAQALALVLVLGSYFGARERRPAAARAAAPASISDQTRTGSTSTARAGLRP